MPKILLFKCTGSGAMPYVFKPSSDDEAADLGPIELSRRELEDLLATGVWAPLDSPESAHNWVRYAEGGEVWAGNQLGPGAPIAKLRGKGGRRLRLPVIRTEEADRWKTTSIQMPDRTRQRLEAIATKRAEATGKRVTISTLINELLEQNMGDMEAES